MSTVMQYGGYNFSPVPFLTINKELEKTGDGRLVGTSFRVGIEGVLTDLVTNQYGGTGICVLDQAEVALRNAFDSDGKLFLLTCDGCVMISGYPRINSLTFSPTNDNWVYRKAFNIEIEYDDDPVGSGENSDIMPPYIKQASESWQVEFLQERSHFSWQLSTGPDANPYQLRLTHIVSATGKRHYGAAGLQKQAWEQARDYVHGQLGYNSTFITQSGFFNLNGSEFNEYNHVRSNTINSEDGSYDATESWIVVNENATGVPGRALEDFTITTRKGVDNSLTTVSIDGSIQGLETVTYGSNPGNYTVNETKFAAATGYWGVVQNRLYARCSKASTGIAFRNINGDPASEVVTYNPPGGIVTYTYEYNDRPANCVSGALSEVFTIQDNFPTDVFASLVVLGRAAGPILQAIDTVTSASRTVDYSVVMQPYTGCPTSAAAIAAMRNASPKAQIDSIMTAFEDDLENNYDQIFKSAHTESWSPKEGRYSQSRTWTFVDCP